MIRNEEITYSIDHLINKKLITARTKHFVSKYGINSIEKLKNTIENENKVLSKPGYGHKTFHDLKLIFEFITESETGRKKIQSIDFDLTSTRSEVFKNKYDYVEKTSHDLKLMTIDEIYTSEDISNRARNLCGQNGLKDLSSILKYYYENKTFLKLRNCGRKSNIELTALSLKYKSFYSDINEDDSKLDEDSSFKHNLVSKLDNFTRAQRDIVNKFIEINKNYLSIRSINSITLFLNGDFKIQNISDKILSNKYFDFRDIRNVGDKTVIELHNFINSLIEFIYKVAEIDGENDLVALKNTFFIEKTFSISLALNKTDKTQSIFGLIDFLVNNDLIFKNKYKQIIFQKSFKIYNEQAEISLDKIAKEINITKERARQIRKIILLKLFNYFEFIRNLEFNLYQKYNIDQNQNLIKVENDLNNLINSESNTNFSIEFNSFIIYTFLSDQFDLIGEIEDVLIINNLNPRGIHNWKCFYLVNKRLSSLFNFIDFANDIHNRLNQRIEETYQFNFKSYLLNFSSLNDVELLNSISEAAEIILNSEFDIYIDTQDNIEFTRNSLKQTHEYALDALRSIGKPSKINEIIEKIIELHPYYETDVSKIRASLNRNFGFVPIGRTSTFGLKEWESKIENFKGGTIRGIVYEYLKSKDDPLHISEIATHVLKYRPKTYDRSILGNLLADQTKTFCFFKNSTIGLKDKKYSNSFVKHNKISAPETKSWEERYDEFLKFTEMNNRLPFSSGCPNYEIKLNRWYRAQKWRIKNKKLDLEKYSLINQIIIRLNRNNINCKSESNNLE